MKKLLKKLFKRIDASLYDAMGKISHTRISSYIILGGIYISSMVFLIIDITNAMMTWIGDGKTYTIPGAHIGLFTLLLGHHLALLGIKKNSENKIFGGITTKPKVEDSKVEDSNEAEEDML